MDSTSIFLLWNISNTKNIEVIDDFVPNPNSERKPNCFSSFHKTSTVCPYLFFTAIILLFLFVIFLLLLFLGLTARTIFLQFSLPISRNSSTFMKLKGLIKGCREDQKLCELEKLRQTDLSNNFKKDKKINHCANTADIYHVLAVGQALCTLVTHLKPSSPKHQAPNL